MPPNHKRYDEIKRKVRELKKFELRIRTNNFNSHSFNTQITFKEFDKTYIRDHNKVDLVWNIFFDLKEGSRKNVKYTIEQLYSMTKDEFKDIIEEYFYHVYYRYYKENGLADSSFINIDILTELGLPMDSNYDDVIKGFKEHVKAYHPDNGGDVNKFLEIMESYNNFRIER